MYVCRGERGSKRKWNKLEIEKEFTSCRNRWYNLLEYDTILTSLIKRIQFLSFKWNGSLYSHPHALTDSSVRIMFLYPIWSLSPGSGLVWISFIASWTTHILFVHFLDYMIWKVFLRAWTKTVFFGNPISARELLQN